MQIIVPGGTPTVQAPGQQQAAYRRTGALYENFSRMGSNMANSALAVEKRPVAAAIWLPAGLVISKLVAMSGTTAFVVGTGTSNRWFGLWRPNLALLGTTTEDGANPWTANTEKPLNIAQFWNGASFQAQGTITTQEAGLHYVGILQQTGATTPGTLASFQCSGGVASSLSLPPILCELGGVMPGPTFGNTDAVTPLVLSSAQGAVPWVWVG